MAQPSDMGSELAIWGRVCGDCKPETDAETPLTATC